MASAFWFNGAIEDIAEKVHNLGSDSLKVAFSNTAPVVTNTVIADITEISGGGYTSGGYAVTVTSSAQTSGTYRLLANDVTATPSGAAWNIRYVVLYNTTATNKLLKWWDNGSTLTVPDGVPFVFAPNITEGIIKIAKGA